MIEVRLVQSRQRQVVYQRVEEVGLPSPYSVGGQSLAKPLLVSLKFPHLSSQNITWGRSSTMPERDYTQ